MVPDKVLKRIFLMLQKMRRSSRDNARHWQLFNTSLADKALYRLRAKVRNLSARASMVNGPPGDNSCFFSQSPTTVSKSWLA